MSINKVILIGRVGKDPEIRQFDGGNKASFSLATSDREYTTKSGTKVPERTEWHNIVCWKGLAQIAEKYIKKGSNLYIEGKITTRSWESDGKKHYITEIVAEQIELLGGKTENSEKPSVQEPPMGEPVYSRQNMDNLPF